MDDNVLFKKPEQQPSQAPLGQMQQPAVQNPFKPPAPTPRPPSSVPPPPSSVPPPPSSVPPPPAQQPPAKGVGPFRDNSSLKRLVIGVVAVILITLLVIFLIPRATSQKVKLVWWGLWEDSQVMESLIADFEKEHPSITIEYSKQDQNQYKDRLLTRINNGTGPDIFRFHNTWYPMLSDVLLPLSTDVISQDEFKKSFYPVMHNDLIHNGGIYGIPLGADTLSLFINTQLLEAAGLAPPEKWEDFVKVAKALTVKDEDGKIQTSGAAFGTYANVTHAPDIIALLFVQQGVDMKKFTTATNDELDAIDFYTSFTTGNQKTWDSTLDASLLSFSQGKLAMYFGYSWDIFAIQKLNKDLPFKTYPVPSLFNRKMSIASYWVEGVSTKSTHQREAFLFMNYLAKKETAQKFYTQVAKTRAFGEPYARTDLADTLKDNALIYPFVSQLENATSSFFASDTHDGENGLNSASNNYLGNAINAIVDDGSSTTTVVDTLNRGIEQVFAKYAIQ